MSDQNVILWKGANRTLRRGLVSLTLLLCFTLGHQGWGQVITDFAPAFGKPGSQVVITGPNFSDLIAVRFNGVQANATRTALTQIIATVPAGATTGPISVTTTQGTTTTPINFVVIGDEPFITDIDPALGLAGTQVTLSGANFANATAVRFNGIGTTFFATADTQILTTAPAGVTTGPISVVNPFGTNTTPVNFFVPPIITRFAPTNGAPGDLVQIFGVNFTEALSVRFNNLPAEFAVISNTNITAFVPPNALSGPISVTAPAGLAFSVTNFIVAPRIDSFAPVIGGPLTSVAIVGANLANASAVRFNGATATFTVVSSERINAIAPNGVTSGPITVVTPGGLVTSTNNFFVAPRISGFSPSGGPTGTVVTITGFNFLGATNVRFGGTNAVITSVTTNQIVATVPARAPTGPVSVAAPAGSATTISNFVVFTTSDLALGQIAAPSPVTASDPLTYTVSVTNIGPKDATAVVLTNTLPLNVVFVSATLSQGTSTLNNRSLRCNFGNLPRGTIATLSLEVIPTVAGTLTNVVTVAGAEPDPVPSNNSSTLRTTVNAPFRPTLSISRNASAPGVLTVSWLKTAEPFLLQSAGSLSQPSWTVIGDISDDGDRYSYSFSSLGLRRFFRLVKVP